MHEVAVDVDACPEHVWAVLADVARWPDWAAGVVATSALDGGPLVVGGGVRVHARRRGTRTFRVAALAPYRGFTWSCTGAGSTETLAVRIVALEDADAAGVPAVSGGGRRTAASPRRSRVTMALDRAGPGAGLAALRPGGGRGVAAAHLDGLATDLRRRCERRRGAVAAPVTQLPVGRPA